MITLVRSSKLTKVATRDILPLRLLINKEESLCQKVLEAEVSEIRTLGVRDDPVMKDAPKMVANIDPVVGKFVELILTATPRSNVNESVTLETLNWALTAVKSPKLEPRDAFGTTELVEIQELASCLESPNKLDALMRRVPKFDPESEIDTDPLVGALAAPKTIVRSTESKDNTELELPVKTAVETTTLDDNAVPPGTLHTMQLSASHREFSHADVPALDDPEMLVTPKSTAEIVTEDDPVDATLAVPRTVILREENENDCVSAAAFKLEEVTTAIEANTP